MSIPLQKKGAPFLALDTITNKQLTNCNHYYNTTSIPIHGNDMLGVYRPVKQAHSYIPMDPIYLENYHQPNVYSFAIDRQYLDAVHNVSIVGPIDQIDKIEVCCIDHPYMYKWSQAPNAESLGISNLQVIETIRSHQLDCLLTMFNKKNSNDHCILAPHFGNGLN